MKEKNEMLTSEVAYFLPCNACDSKSEQAKVRTFGFIYITRGRVPLGPHS